MTKNEFKIQPVQYNGIIYDSTLECKYALSIEDHCDYYYHPFTIWYDKRDSSRLGKQYNGKYTPDFLVRDLRINKTYLVEVKSSSYRYHYEVLKKERITNHYIASKGHDWEYIIITENDFILPSSKYDKLSRARKTSLSTFSRKRFAKVHNKYSSQLMNHRACKMPLVRHLNNLCERDYVHFVKTGIVRNSKS